MKPIALSGLSLLVLARFATGAVPSETTHTQTLGPHTFTLPASLVIELAASPDLIPRPVSGSFDPQGRFYVTDSSGSNRPPSEQLENPDHRILCLEDTDGDGRFDRSTVFADHVMFPQGCLWHNGSVYVAGPPSIWKFTDTNGDGKADQREEWYRGEVLTGCANDVHGPYLGPDGFLYWTKGAFARLNLIDGRGRPIRDRAAHVFRARPDGSGLESILTGGMDNPVELAFTAEGEPILISTFIDLSQPGRRDGLAHAIYGGVFGKANDALEEPMVRRTGDLLPVLTHFGPAAACALHRYTTTALGSPYHDSLFATLFNLRKVTHHTLSLEGASYASQDQDFLTSDHPDFRPTDVLEDADGSLLVIDTGGWYKLCCPSSQLAKDDVLGGIYRIRQPNAPRLTPTERAAAYPRLIQPPPLSPTSPLVPLRQAATAAHPDSASLFLDTLEKHLPHLADSPTHAHLVRLAAEGLGRLAHAPAIPPLIQALSKINASDRFLEHSLLHALIEIGHSNALRPYLTSPDPIHNRAALLALEQINQGQPLSLSDVLPFLTRPEPTLRDTAFWVVRRHPDWTPDLARSLGTRLALPDLSASERATIESLLPWFARQPAGQPLLADLILQATLPLPTRLAALQSLSQTKKPVPAWESAVLHLLNSGQRHGLPSTPDPDLERELDLLHAALRTARTLTWSAPQLPILVQRLLTTARNTSFNLPTRLDALAALPAHTPVDSEEVHLLATVLGPAQPSPLRLIAAQTASRLRLLDTHRQQLLPALAEAGPVEMPRLLPAFAGGQSPELGNALLEILKRSSAARALRPEDILATLTNYPPPLPASAATWLESRRTDSATDRRRLDQLLAELQTHPGDIRRGQALFNSERAACASCHRIGYLGGDLGPDLTAIGTIRSDRDLLEAIVFPSASFVRSYEPWTVTTPDGDDVTGVLRRDTSSEIILATGPGTESRIPREQVANLQPATLSTMPAGLDDQLTRQELADLLAFLRNTRWGLN